MADIFTLDLSKPRAEIKRKMSCIVKSQKLNETAFFVVIKENLR